MHYKNEVEVRLDAIVMPKGEWYEDITLELIGWLKWKSVVWQEDINQSERQVLQTKLRPAMLGSPTI